MKSPMYFSMIALILISSCVTSNSSETNGFAYSPIEQPVLTREVNNRINIGMTIASDTMIVQAIKDGIVYNISYDETNPTNFGKFIDIIHKGYYREDGEDKYYDYHVIYANMKNIIDLSIGEEVKKGETLGEAGGTSPLEYIQDLFLCIYTKDICLPLKAKCNGVVYYELGYYWYDPMEFFGLK